MESPPRHRHPAQEALHAAAPSQLACAICGQYALSAYTPHADSCPVEDRMICTRCGAHRILPM